ASRPILPSSRLVSTLRIVGSCELEVDQAVQAGALAFAMLNTQPGIALQQGLQIQVRLVTDQLQFDAVALADGFVSAERQHPEVVLEAGQVQGEGGFIGGGKHPQVLVQYRCCRYSELRPGHYSLSCPVSL